ncbi:PTS sugar transporter subunit IIC [Lactiplantibacillus fabifermentans]|uniref:Permease IIC component n=2 Tax=Lactiplantibacillus fabifermentans TaxID=483011 RepID=A0A0R2NL24_9LACO|nr:PTS transporter subunit EIIC [Lactiplantibacillus fabifermentans]ETY72945.1 PTS cellobiose transporter subunit IIC [Lactiplantibacillus fabifermentans T30PCM01]KRO26420.1 phosphoenolpyruvate-dependent sugar phosphotransferase system eiic, putative cellobiose specific [Lactiplantibacillus fabifermentans DSM 21115]
MQTFIKKMQFLLDPVLTKFSNLKALLILDMGMRYIGPLMLIASLFVIITQLPFAGWQHFIASWPQLKVPIELILGYFSLIVAISMSFATTKINQISPQVGATTGIVAYLLALLNQHGHLQVSQLGPTSFFTALIVPLMAIELLTWLNNHNLKLQPKHNLPPAVPTSFTSVLPALGVILVFWLLQAGLPISINQLVNVIFKPLIMIFNSWLGITLILILTLFLWMLGIHGNNVIGALLSPFYLQSLLVNALNVTHGQAATRVTADGFLNFGMNIGGTGAILALTLCALTAKSKRFKEIGKAGLMPAIFGISEPVVFGLPVVMNPAFMIPFIAIPVILQTMTYYLMNAHLIGMVVAQVPWTTPTILNGFLVTGGDWRAAVWQLIELVIAVAIYWPFFRAYDHQNQLKETAALKTA